MFNKPFETRLAVWREFRESLETAEDPLRSVIEFYNITPTISLNVDPWEEDSWPDPWELLSENLYCEFTRVLGMCYSLQLTDRFKGSKFEIHIVTDNSLGYVYLLYVDDKVIGWEDDTYVDKEEIPKSYVSQKVYSMSALQ